MELKTSGGGCGSGYPDRDVPDEFEKPSGIPLGTIFVSKVGQDSGTASKASVEVSKRQEEGSKEKARIKIGLDTGFGILHLCRCFIS